MGSLAPVFMGCISGPGTLSGSNYIAIGFTLPTAAVSVDVLRTASPLGPVGACNCAVAAGNTTGQVNDQSNSLNSYTVNTFDPRILQMTLLNYVVGSGARHLFLCQPNQACKDLTTVGGVGGSGTAGNLTEWTGSATLGNAPITDSGSNMNAAELFRVCFSTACNSFLTNSFFVNDTFRSSGTCSAGTGLVGCDSVDIQQTYLGNSTSRSLASLAILSNWGGGASATFGTLNGAYISATAGSPAAITNEYGVQIINVVGPSGSGDNNTTVSGTIYGLKVQSTAQAHGGSILYPNHVGLDVATNVFSFTGTGPVTNDYSILIETPQFSQLPGVFTAHYGLYVKDQGAQNNCGSCSNNTYGAYVATPTTNTQGGVNYALYVQGGPSFFGGPVTFAGGQNGVAIPASLTTTSATSDNVTVTGMTSSGHCSLTATNASAATNIATSYVSAKTTNQITVTHTATSGMTYDILCTPN